LCVPKCQQGCAIASANTLQTERGASERSSPA
jgi:hypothetical protein